MYVFCAGMYRSASTWQYHVISHLVETLGVGRRLGFYSEIESERFREHYAQYRESAEFLVLKSHQRHPEYATALAEGKAFGVYIYRDLRDVAFSLTHRFNTTFEEVVRQKRLIHHSIENDKFWRSQPRVHVQQYQQVVDDPVAAVLELAKHLGLSVSSELAESVAHEYSFSANLARTTAVGDRFVSKGLNLSQPENSLIYDEHTLLGWNHMRQGRQGGWRDEASQDQLLTLLATCGAWLILRGFEKDFGWAWRGQASYAEGQGSEWALRGVLEWCEGEGRQIMALQDEVAQLTHRFHEADDRLRKLTARNNELEVELSRTVYRLADHFARLCKRIPLAERAVRAVFHQIARRASQKPS
jgi:hypothetical protein